MVTRRYGRHERSEGIRPSFPGHVISRGKDPDGPEKRRERARWRLHLYSCIPALLVIVGLFVLTYPATAEWFTQYDQSRVIDTASRQIARGKVSPSVKKQLEQAHAYNDALSSGAVLEANHRLPTGSGISDNPHESLDYNKILAGPEGMMARLRIPSIKVDLPVYHGTSDETLLKGVGHLEGTSLPVGGKGTHAVLTGHRGLATAVMFTNLNKVRKGNTFVIEVFGETLTYRVFNIRVVNPDDTTSLKADPDKDLVTLVTCTPLGINSQRILVTGERISPTPRADVAAAGKAPDIPGFPWWAVIQTIGVAAAAVFIWWTGYPQRGGRKSIIPAR
jgi:sortase A